MSCDNKDTGHIYDELSMFTMIPPLAVKNATPSPKSGKVVFDTSRVQPPSYQPLPKPHYKSCSASSMEKCNDYHIERDVRSIKDEDCYFLKPHYESCNASSKEECNDYQSGEDTRSITDENCQKMTDRTEHEPYSKLVHHK